MHDFILSAVARENDSDHEGDTRPIKRPAIVSFATHRTEVFCPVCQEIVLAISPAEAARLFKTDLQDVQFLLKNNMIHAVREDQAVVSICRTSLENCFERRRTRLLDSHFELAIRRGRGR